MVKRLFKTKQVLYFIVLSLMTAAVSFAGDWEVRSGLEVNKRGMTEAILPAELLLQKADGAYDFLLKGPDNNPRAFQIYKKEKTGKKRIDLRPQKIELSDDGAFIWECDLPDLRLSDLRVIIADRNYLGKIHVEAKDSNGWDFIARNQAVYQTGGSARAKITIKEGDYKKLRLYFLSFDKKYRKKIVTIDRISGAFKKTGKAYKLKRFDMSGEMKLVQSGDFTEIKTLLPGSGLDIKSLDFKTGIQFKGVWEAGYEIIRNSESEFVRLKIGTISYPSRKKTGFSALLEQRWPGKSLVIRLWPDTGFIGEISALKVNIHLPRLLFFADMKGHYQAFTGTGREIKIQDYPGEAGSGAPRTVVFEKPERNPLYNTKTLVEKYRIKGGPFNEAGYTWTSLIPLSGPGYYKLNFNLRASLDREYKKVRLAKDGFQIPFFFGGNENKSIELPADSDYDSRKNQTSWTITLPAASNQWLSLAFSGSGIFKRRLVFYKKKPGNTGWQAVFSKKWQNKGPEETLLNFDFPDVFKGQTRFKIVVDHGDNQPLYIKSFKAFYNSPSLCFLAHEGGDYTLFGGNEKAEPARFDLSLVQQRLLETLPREIEMQEIEKRHPDIWGKKVLIHFQEQGWGLYIILGVVTIILILVITRLFPAIEKTEPVKRINEK